MQRNLRRWGAGAGLVAAGAVAGGVLASTLSASADTAAPTPTSSSSSTGTGSEGPGDPSRPQRPDETLLTGDTKAKVEAAALAKYPGATIERTETDSDGVYESHIVTTDGQHVIVQVGSDFAVTGTQTGGGHGGPGGQGSRGHRADDGDADDLSGSSGSSGSSGGSSSGG